MSIGMSPFVAGLSPNPPLRVMASASGLRKARGEDEGVRTPEWDTQPHSDGPQRLGPEGQGMGYRHVVGAMLAVTLFSGIASAESSARVQIEEFFRRATAILSEDPDVDRARDDVRDVPTGSDF